jgi:hypothetical protein
MLRQLSGNLHATEERKIKIKIKIVLTSKIAIGLNTTNFIRQ